MKCSIHFSWMIAVDFKPKLEYAPDHPVSLDSNMI